jgi:hypothetical protein
MQFKDFNQMIDITSSEPSAQSYSPLHFKDAEIHPLLAHIYSLAEQAGEAEYNYRVKI